MKNKLQNYLGSIYIILAAFFFGLMPFFTKVAYADGSNTYSVCVFRFTFACIGFAVYNLLNKKITLKVSINELKKLFLMSIFYAVTPMLLYSSYLIIPSTLASSLHFTYPLWTIILMMVLFREKLTVKQLICTFLCALGMILLYTPGAGSGKIIGMILAVLSGLTYASYVVTLGRSKLTIPVTVQSFYITLFASIELWVFCGLSGQLTFEITNKAWLAQIGLAIFSTVFALILFQLGIKYVSEIKASLLSTFEPVTSVLFGIFFFHESLTLRLAIGIIFILLSTVILVIKSQNK